MNKENTPINQQDGPQQEGRQKNNAQNIQGPIDTTDISNTMKDPDAWKTGEESSISLEPEASNSFDSSQDRQGVSNMIKNPDEWKTGEEPMTGAQRSYLQTLSDEAGEQLDTSLTKAEASKRIDELQQKTGRGLNQSNQAGGENQG